jgi:YidC/Oxa1 family membrane protein insertase
MTAFFAFSVPAGLGLYWIVGNIIQVLQQLYINKVIKKKKEVAVK